MNTQDNRHTPTADFVSSLEREVLRAYRDEAPATPLRLPPKRRWLEQWRVAAALVIGLAFGAGAQLASAQVQGARNRGELQQSLEVAREVQVYRLQIAQQEHQRVRSAFAAGALSQQSLLEAAAELRAMETALAKLDADLAEVSASNAAPRDELWAPLVGGRDFVKQRLQLAAAQAQQRLTTAEAHLATVERSVRVGAETIGTLQDAQLLLAEASRDLGRVMMQLKVRDQFLEEKLEPAEVTRRLQREVMRVELVRAEQMLGISTARLKLAQDRVSVGTMTPLELKRLELDVMERTAELDRLRVEMRAQSQINWQFGRNTKDAP